MKTHNIRACPHCGSEPYLQPIYEVQDTDQMAQEIECPVCSSRMRDTTTRVTYSNQAVLMKAWGVPTWKEAHECAEAQLTTALITKWNLRNCHLNFCSPKPERFEVQNHG